MRQRYKRLIAGYNSKAQHAGQKRAGKAVGLARINQRHTEKSYSVQQYYTDASSTPVSCRNVCGHSRSSRDLPPRPAPAPSRPRPTPPARRLLAPTTSSRLASQLLVCMDELARWRAAGLRVAAAATTTTGNTVESAQDGHASPSSAAESTGQSAGSSSSSSSANVMVLAATNAPEAVDAAFLRPGRFDEVGYNSNGRLLRGVGRSAGR